MPCKACHKPKVVFKQGTAYREKETKDDYLCVRVSFRDFALVSLKSGNRFTDPRPLEELQREAKRFEILKEEVTYANS